ncbi:phospholipase D family protein [Paenibacillus sp. MBLB4367]|uniref:phospholipase D family protein n=1 Tax=Paenibacillus sp. MBLB4367 TaxID=3384767 RepID=UPI0039083E75
MSNTNIKVLATGLGWLGNGVESITTNVEELFNSAKYELFIAAYSISAGALEVILMLNTPLSRGVDVRLLINKYEQIHPSVKSIFDDFSKKYMNISIFDFNHPDNYDLHAKMIVADREKAIIGSSNISRRGFFENHELAVMITGNEVIKVASAFDSLLANKLTRKVDL